MNDHPYRPYLRALSEAEVFQSKLKQRAYLDSLLMVDLRERILALERDHMRGLQRIDELTQEVTHLNLVVDDQSNTIRDLQSMRTWRYTAWLRWLGRQFGSLHKCKPSHGDSNTATKHPRVPLEQKERPDPLARDYGSWVMRFDASPSAQPADQQTDSSQALQTDHPIISILTPACALPASGNKAVREQLKMLTLQTLSHWEWLLACSFEDRELVSSLQEMSRQEPRFKPCLMKPDIGMAASFNSLCQQAQGQWLMHLPWEVVLPPHALQCLVQAVGASEVCKVIYADEDHLDQDGHRHSPVFKPDYNPELLLTRDYLGHPVMVRKTALIAAGGLDPSVGAAAKHDLWLRLSQGCAPGQIVHLPRIVAHTLPAAPGHNEAQVQQPHRQAHAQAVQRHLKRLGTPGHVSPDPCTKDGSRVYLTLPEPAPSVSIIIPTRDRVGLLAMCLSSLMEKTRYDAYRVVVVDNGSEREETRLFLSQLNDPRITVLRDDREFNFSRLVNQGVGASRADVVCLLNNDIEVTEPDWLREMVSWAVQPGVAAVGARLWYGEGFIQHAGVTLGIQGIAGHEHKGLRKGEASYLDRAIELRTVSAVTGACMVVKRQVFEELGGFDEQLPVAYNDIDFCLKAIAKGYRNVYTPHAELIHHESITRGLEDSAAKRDRLAGEAAILRSRWAVHIDNDPAYNPNLTLDKEDCSLAFPPRVPWLNVT